MDFDPKKFDERLERIERALFGFETPDYKTAPCAENPFPPIHQVDTGERNKQGEPIMRDVLVRTPGLFDTVNDLASRIAGGTIPAGEGANLTAHTATGKPAKQPRKPRKCK